MIHPTAMVESGARLGANVKIGAGAIVGGEVSLGDDCEVGPYAILSGKTAIGDRTRIYPHAVVGIEPQDLSYAGEPTELIIGNDNVIREFATLHRGTAKGHGKTVVGSHNLIMAYSHVAHDCVVGHHNIFSNGATLAGHVEIGDAVTIGGLAALHQFTRVGSFAFIGGCSAVSQDVPPFFLASGNHAVTTGVNKIGLQRRGRTEEQVRTLVTCFKVIYLREKLLRDAVAELETIYAGNDDVKALLDFIRTSKRGILRYGRPTGA